MAKPKPAPSANGFQPKSGDVVEVQMPDGHWTRGIFFSDSRQVPSGAKGGRLELWDGARMRQPEGRAKAENDTKSGIGHGPD